MFSVKEKFKSNPTAYYGLSIAASWAGVGSLLNTITISKTLGIIPALIWTVANVLACVIFGFVIHKLPTLREVIKSKVVFYTIALMTVFQVWLNMNGIREVFSDTSIGVDGGTFLAYAVAGIFVFLLLWRGMIRNILTDSASWLVVYGLIAFITAITFMQSGGQFNVLPLGMESENLSAGALKAFLLLPGPFTFVYFYELLNYNDENPDNTQKADMQKSFTYSGIFFGVYMLFVLALAFVNFPPELNLVKAILLSLVAISSLSTFIFSIYLVFGRKLGLLIDATAIIFWSKFIDMGVMGVWQMVASIRSYLVGGMILAAMYLMIRSKKNAASIGT